MSARRLVVNVDHVATVREARGGREPDPIVAANLALLAGADGIVVHLREDCRHIQERDVRLLREIVPQNFNLEITPTPERVKLALEIRPDSVTLVPERREELTTEGGLDVCNALGAVGETVRQLHAAEVRSCLFIDAELEQVQAARSVAARSIEIHTGRYAQRGPGQEVERGRIFAAVRMARGLELEVGVGHGLDYHNVAGLAEAEEIVEFSIGHSIVSRALLVGMDRAVQEMKLLVG